MHPSQGEGGSGRTSCRLCLANKGITTVILYEYPDKQARPILSPITLWVWPIYWATGQLIAGQSPSPGDGKTTNLYQAYLIFHGRLIAR